MLEIESDARGFNNGNFAATNAITISPVFEYQEEFNMLEDELRSFFPGYLFVPYVVGMSTIKNISIADESRDPRSMDTIYEALFGVGAVHNCLTRGDQYYGMSDWVKPLNKKEKLLVDVISQHVIGAPKGTTIHKVWKLLESNELETLKVSGNLMFGVGLFDIIDLTDKSKFIMISKERGAPSSGEYNINKEMIQINANFSLRIVELSNAALTLNLILNLEHGDVSVKGEVMELKFTQLKKI